MMAIGPGIPCQILRTRDPRPDRDLKAFDRQAEVTMSFRKWIVLSAIWGASLAIAGAWAHAQTPAPPVPPQTTPNVISGPDVGFRVERREGATAVGSLVVRINGQWVDTKFNMASKRLTVD